jgi:chemotaxis protein MotB
MSGAGKAHAEEPEDEAWLMTYADMITLLMAFFVLMASVSKVDQEAYDNVSAALNEDRTKEKNKQQEVKQTMQRDIKDIISNEGADQAVQMGTDAQGSITLTLDGGAFFKPATADLQEQALPVLKGIVEELSNPIYQQFNISIEGHTDDGQISNARYPSNWELSTGRAATVVRFFADARIPATASDPGGDPLFARNRLRAIGYADTQPKAPNRDLNGVAIPENQAANRRVIMRINRKPIFEQTRIPSFRRTSAADTDAGQEVTKGKKK